MFTSNAIDYITCSIRQTITDIANDTIPNIIICIRKDNPPWLTTAITNQIRRKKRIHKRTKQTNLEGHWVKFRKARNICNKLILNANTKYYSSISEKIHTETTGSKNWWNLVKSLLGDYNNRSIPPIQTNDYIIHDDADKSEMFNDLFCDQSNINDDYLIPPDLDGPSYEKLRQIIITETDVDDILKTLDTSKATGSDMLNLRLLKEASSILKCPLCKLF